MSLDIETGIETFEITVLISRLVSRLKKQEGVPVIETLARVTAHLWSSSVLISARRLRVICAVLSKLVQFSVAQGIPLQCSDLIQVYIVKLL